MQLKSVTAYSPLPTFFVFVLEIGEEERSETSSLTYQCRNVEDPPRREKSL